MIRYKCSHCGQEMQSPESMAGQYETCPKCEQLTPVVGPAPTIPPAVPKRGSPAKRSNTPPPPGVDEQMLAVLKDIRSEIRWITIWIKLVVAFVVVVALVAFVAGLGLLESC